MRAIIRRHFSFAGVVAILALILAMSGGAWAAKKYLITSVNQISPSVLKKLKGKRGPRGREGTQGVEGKEGKQGPEGKEGKEGKEGPEGKEGKEGSPWTAGGTLPSGKTETGVWDFGINFAAPAATPVSMSFPIPLASAIPTANVHFVAPAETGVTGCPGTATNPKADPGHMCIYAQVLENVTYFTELGEYPHSYVSGVTAVFVASEPTSQGRGTWAVTAP